LPGLPGPASALLPLNAHPDESGLLWPPLTSPRPSLIVADEVVRLRHTLAEYLQMAKVFASIDFSEGTRMTKSVIDLAGDHMLMYASDHPHPETLFPDHIDFALPGG